jgi:hypothetical protein
MSSSSGSVIFLPQADDADVASRVREMRAGPHRRAAGRPITDLHYTGVPANLDA